MLEALLTHYPKKEYWIQLSNMYGEQKKEGDQLAAMDTAYVQGMLTKDSELVTMAYIYLNGETPYPAAKVMDKGLRDDQIEGTSKNWELAGNAWRQAQELEKAIPALEKAAEKSDKGELYSNLASMYLDKDDYKKAITAANRALSRGGLKRPDTTRLVLGMAYFNDDQYDKAREAFTSAGKDERSSKYADQWIKYMDSELERQKALREEDAALEKMAQAAAGTGSEPASDEAKSQEPAQADTGE